jgi:hypothetical protein
MDRGFHSFVEKHKKAVLCLVAVIVLQVLHVTLNLGLPELQTSAAIKTTNFFDFSLNLTSVLLVLAAIWTYLSDPE